MLRDLQKTLVFCLLCSCFVCYSFYLYGNLDDSPIQNTAKADHGKRIWQENNCIACHQIYQLGGYLGPDLTNTYSTKGPEYIKVFVKNGTAVMPKFNLDETALEALVTYLKEIDATGSADPRTFTISTNGMIEQQ